MPRARTMTQAAPRSSWLERLDARPQLLATLAYLVAVSTAPPGDLAHLAALAALLGAVLIWARLPLRARFWLRLAPVLAVACAMAVVVALTRDGGPRWELRLGPVALEASQAGLLAAAEVVARTALAASALVALSLSSSGPALLGALAWLRLPAPFLAVIGQVARALGLLTGEAERMNRARELRTLHPRPALTLRAVGGVVGSLLLRSMHRAQRVHRAMLARGFDGAHLVQLPPPPVPTSHSLGATLFAAASLAGPWLLP